MEAAATTAFQLLQLPDACLLCVLQRLGDSSSDTNHRSLFSAACAHSRLHVVAAEALTALQAAARNQQQADGALAYLSRHGQHVTSISLSVRWHFGAATYIRQLPSQCSQLRSLSFSGPMRLQLGASSSHPGVLSTCAGSLTRLEVDRCRLLDDSAAGAAAGLATLTGLQHLQLKLSANATKNAKINAGDGLPGQVWGLSRLTHLTLGSVLSADDTAALEGVSRLAQLQELKLSQCSRRTVRPAVLSGLQLTRLALHNGRLEPAALACVSQLRHLELSGTVVVPVGEAGVAALLAQLATMQQLSALCLNWVSLWQSPGGNQSTTAAYSALTASSSLRQLDIWGANMPKGVWQHVFAGPRTALDQLQLRSEPEFEDCEMSSAELAALVDCCPRLQGLVLPALEGDAQLRPLAALLHLTSLEFPDGPHRREIIHSKAPQGDPPDVWRQLLEELDEFQS